MNITLCGHLSDEMLRYHGHKAGLSDAAINFLEYYTETPVLILDVDDTTGTVRSCKTEREVACEHDLRLLVSKVLAWWQDEESIIHHTQPEFVTAAKQIAQKLC